MQWSKLKKQVESRFSAAVAGRVELRTTTYREADDAAGRGWITLDGKELYDFSTLEYWSELWKLTSEIQEANQATDWTDPNQRTGYYDGITAAEEILEKRGLPPQDRFDHALRSYLHLSVEEALTSSDLIHRSLAVLDRRLGKRRLQSLVLSDKEHELVKTLLAFRCLAEGIKSLKPAY